MTHDPMFWVLVTQSLLVLYWIVEALYSTFLLRRFNKAEELLMQWGQRHNTLVYYLTDYDPEFSIYVGERADAIEEYNKLLVARGLKP